MLLTTGETPVDPWAPVKASAPPPPAPRRDPLPLAPSTTPIKHIVYIIKENRTYDNLFGRFPEGDGATTGKDAGRHHDPAGPAARQAGRPPAQPLLGGEGHQRRGHERLLRHQGQGRTPDDDGLYHRQPGPAARLLGLGAPLWPRRPHVHVGAELELPEPPLHRGRPVRRRDRRAQLPAPAGGDATGRPTPPSRSPPLDTKSIIGRKSVCVDIPSVAGQTTRHPGVTWSTYGAMPGQLGYGWVALDAVKRVRESVTWDAHYAPWQWFTSDVKQGHLASITWMTPPFNESDHPGGPSLCQGENWTARQVNAIESSPLWKSTAIVIVWDDFGGFYDHVATAAVRSLRAWPALAAAGDLTLGEARHRPRHLRLHVGDQVRGRELRAAAADLARAEGQLAALGLPVPASAEALDRAASHLPEGEVHPDRRRPARSTTTRRISAAAPTAAAATTPASTARTGGWRGHPRTSPPGRARSAPPAPAP